MSDQTAAHRKGRLMRELFTVLAAAPDGIAAKDAIQAVRARVTLTPDEEGVFADGAEKFPKVVRFATITVVKAGWMTKRDGTWAITDAGRAAIAAHASPEELWGEARTLYARWKRERTVEVVDEDDSDETLSEATSLEDDQDRARSEVLEYITTMSPFDFQAACAKLVEALGHRVAWISPPGPDGGLDFVAYADPIGATGRRIKGQAKRSSASKQDVDDVSAFLAKLKGDDAGVFIALGGFTRPAEAMVRADERRLVLIDGGAFVRLWIEHYDRLDEDARGLLRLTPVWRLVRPVD